MKINIISIFPEMFDSVIQYGVLSRAIKKKLIKVCYFNPRNYSKRKKIDDKPYGGGPGMIMTFQPLQLAILDSKKRIKGDFQVIYLTPKGKQLNSKIALNLSKYKNLILICGRYQGLDERIIQKEVDQEISIGQYILSGGELAAMILIDVISRFIPGVLGNYKSITENSFFNGLLDSPRYTRPQKICDMLVPKVLLSGNHKNIKEWKFKSSLIETILKCPELLLNKKWTEEEKSLLQRIKQN